MRTYSYTVNGARYDVTIESLRDQVAKLNVNGIAFDVEILALRSPRAICPKWLPLLCPPPRLLLHPLPLLLRHPPPKVPPARARPSLLPSPAW